MEKFDWNQVRAFLATVEAGSLSAAARQLGLTQPTLGRQVAGLEQDLGVVLFERVGRGLVLTEAGRDLAEHVRAMGAAADKMALAATGQSQAVDGLVRVTASDIVASYMLAPAWEKLRARAPGIVVEVVASNALTDLLRREADIAVRHVAPTQQELIGKRLPDSGARLYASRDYLDRIGRPKTLAELARADFIGFSERNADLIAQLNARGLPVTTDHFPLLTGSGLVAWHMVQQGLGIGIMMQEAAAFAPAVEEVFPDFGAVPVPVWLVTHRELHTSRRIRLVFDLLAETLSTRR